MCHRRLYFVFFFNDTATTEIYTLSLHDALPIYREMQVANLGAQVSVPELVSAARQRRADAVLVSQVVTQKDAHLRKDRKSTRLNSSHANISYAVFCLKKKKQHTKHMNHVMLHLH